VPNGAHDSATGSLAAKCATAAAPPEAAATAGVRMRPDGGGAPSARAIADRLAWPADGSSYTTS
jgi:hypothetical protein